MEGPSSERKKTCQTFGRKKTSVAVAHVKPGRGLVKINGIPMELTTPESMRWKVLDPFLLMKNPKTLNQQKRVFDDLDIRVRVKGGGRVAQTYAVRQAIARGVVAYYQKFVDEQSKMAIKELFLKYDRSLLVSDPRRTESKKFGGPGARARYQKSYR